MRAILTSLLVLAAPAPLWAFVPHEYPAIYTHQIGNLFYLVALLVFLWAIHRNRLYREKEWRYLFISVICFIVWDITIMTSRFAEALWITPSQTVGGTAGWAYFTRSMVIEEGEYLYYLGRFDFWILNVAMLFFYFYLREHLKKDNQPTSTTGLALLPLLPILITDISGNIIFIILAVMSLVTSVKLYRQDRDNVLWRYMVWLSSSYVMFSFSRSFGHILKHILIPTGNEHVWAYLDGITGSFNTSIRFLVAMLTLFFVWIYQIYLKMSRDKEEMELINLDLTDLNQELENLVAERTMALMGLTVADRVRNPAAIIGCACKRILSKEKDGKYGESLKDVVDECKKLEAIVGDFENLLRINRGLFKYEDMHVILKGVVTVLEKEAEKKGVRMVLKYVSYPLKINMHRNLLKAAIYHVIRNAIEATPPGGTITLITEEQDDSVVLTIVDTGPGIPKENLERIFDPFFSTKQMRFGMGLALVKQIVSEHLGEISVESDVGSGTTFRLTLPKRWVEKKTDIQALTT